MTLQEITDIIAAHVRDTSSTTQTRLNEFVNQVMFEIAKQIQFVGEERTGIIRTTSGRAQYALEPDVLSLIEPLRVVEANQSLYSVPRGAVETWMPSTVSTGVPLEYSVVGTAPVKRQPRSVLRLVSDAVSGSDTRTVTIYGIVDGLTTHETVTLTGTTAVLTTNAYTQLTDAPTASAISTQNTITITANSPATATNSHYPTVAQAGSVTVATIAANATTPTAWYNPGSIIRVKMDADTSGDRSQTITIEGYIISGATPTWDRQFHREVLTTTNPATTEVRSSSRFTTLTRISKNWDATNNLLVYADQNSTSTADNLIAVVSPEQRSSQYPQIALYPLPTGQAITYRYVARMTKLINASDEPPFDARYHYLLVKWGEWLMRGMNDDARGGVQFSTHPEFLHDVAVTRQTQPVQRNPRLVVGRGGMVVRPTKPGAWLDPSVYDNR